MKIIENRKYFLSLSGILVLASLAAIIVFGLRTGIDLKGGAEWQISFPSSTAATIINEEPLMAVFDNTNKEKKFSSIGPTIGAELRRKSIFAIVAVLFAISFYIAWAFRKVSEPVKSWKYGVVTLITLFHDVMIPTGLLVVLGIWRGVEIDSNFIVALLVVMGFSVHDTIVVFDRIRENLLLNRNRHKLDEVINYSVKETMVRSINTSLTLVLVLLTMLFFGPESLFYFILTILVGTIFGTYSSIFVASPLLFVWQKKRE